VIHLAIAAVVMPLQSQEFIFAVVLNPGLRAAIDFTSSAPVDLGQRISRELSGIPVKLTDSGIEMDLSVLKSRTEVRAVGLKVEEILMAAGSKISHRPESGRTEAKKFDQRDSEFLDNVPPHHGG